MEASGVHDTTSPSIIKYDFDIWKDLFSISVLTDGTTMGAGIGERIYEITHSPSALQEEGRCHGIARAQALSPDRWLYLIVPVHIPADVEVQR
jgi:hypothetical protein